MKQKNRILSWVLAVCLCMSLAAPAALAAEETGGQPSEEAEIQQTPELEIEERSLDLGEYVVQHDNTAGEPFSVTLKNTGSVAVEVSLPNGSRTQSTDMGGHQISIWSTHMDAQEATAAVEPGASLTLFGSCRIDVEDALDLDSYGEFSVEWTISLNVAAAGGEAVQMDFPVTLTYELVPLYGISPAVIDLGEIPLGESNDYWYQAEAPATLFSNSEVGIRSSGTSGAVFERDGENPHPGIAFDPRIYEQGGDGSFVIYGEGELPVRGFGRFFRSSESSMGEEPPYGEYTVSGTYTYGIYDYAAGGYSFDDVTIPVVFTYTIVPTEESTDPEEPVEPEEGKKYDLSISTTSLDFGTLALGYDSVPSRTITVTNTGTERLYVSHGILHAGPYTVEENPESNYLDPGASKTYTVTPIENIGYAGNYDDELAIDYHGVELIVSLSLTVEGDAAMSLSPNSMDFGTAADGYDQPAAKTVTVTNTGDTELTLRQPTAEDYEIGDLSRTTLSAGQTATFTVRPKAGLEAGSHSETVSLRAGEAGSVSLRLSFTVMAEDEAEPFTDVSESSWFYDAVVYAFEHELMNGTSDTLFAPNATLTRGMMVTVLWRIDGESAAAAAADFSDVAADSWYADAVAWASEEGIVTGTTETTFAPDANITREQLATMLYRYADYKGYDLTGGGSLDGFTDRGSVSSYAEEAVAWAVSEELMSGVDSVTLSPKGSATRAQTATILMRFLENMAK